MSIYYDPQKRTIRLWVKVVFFILPLILVLLGWLFFKSTVVPNATQEEVSLEGVSN